MKLTERKKMILIHIAWILALAVILWQNTIIPLRMTGLSENICTGQCRPEKESPVYFMRYTRH